MSPNAELKMLDDESEIPRLAAVAFRHARSVALSRGYRVLYIKNDQLVESESGHEERVLRDVKTTIHAKKGTRVLLKTTNGLHA
jgi:hypothetical protein